MAPVGQTARHVAMMSIEDTGHVNPMIALAEVMVQEGWTVHFFVPQEVRARVEAAGAVWCSYGAEDWQLAGAARTATLRELGREVDVETVRGSMPFCVVPATLEVLPHLVKRVGDIQPEFIVHDAAVPWGWVLGKFLGIPTVCSMSALPSSLEAREKYSTKWSETGQKTLDAAAAAIEAKYGVHLNHNYSYSNYTPYTIVWSSRYWHKGNAEFDQQQFRYWGPLTSTQYGRDVVEEEENSPLVFVSLGTIATSKKTPHQTAVLDFYAKVLAAARLLPDVSFVFSVGKAVSVTTTDAEKIITVNSVEVPPNVVAVRNVDQVSVLRRAKAFVTHCGQNSSSETILAEVPIVACPMGSDQHANAERFVDLGCGLLQSYAEKGKDSEKDLNKVTAESLAESIRAVLQEPRFAEAMRDLNARQSEECGDCMAEKIADLVAHVRSQAAAGTQGGA